MNPVTPNWHPYDPGEPSEVAFQNDCSLLVLLATPAAREAEWAERTAVSLAREWSRRGERVFLVDLGFRRPRLHEALGEANGEGMSDVLLYGASLRRIARPVSDGFLYASTGTPVLDGARALASPRWSSLADGFAQAGAQLVAFLPADEPGKEAVLEHAHRIVVLAGAGEGEDLPVGVDRERVGVVLAPAASARKRPAEPVEVARGPGVAGPAQEDQLVPGETAGQPGAITSLPGAAMAETYEERAAEAPAPPLRPLAPLTGAAIRPELPVEQDADGERVPLARIVVVAILVVMLLVVVLAALGVLPLPGLGGMIPE